MSNSTYIVEESKDVALVQLNKTWQYPGLTNIIYYYNDDSDVDFLYSIGKSSGFGPGHYSMIQAHEETVVIRISLTDVSGLVYDQKALCFCNPDNRYSESRWYLVEAVPIPTSDLTVDPGTPSSDSSDYVEFTRTFTELIEPAIYRNLDDGFRWFFVDGILKREDDFLTSEQTLELIKQNVGYFKKPILEIVFDFPEGTKKSGNSYYLPNIEYVDQPKFKIRVFDYSGANITDDCTISVIGSEITYNDETGKYTIMRRYITDSKIVINANSESLQTSETISLWFPEIAYYGTCTVRANSEITIGTLTSKLIYHDLDSINLVYNLEMQNSILLIPTNFNKFNHIFDINKLDYIDDYIYIENFEYQDKIYNVYRKIEPIIINDFKQLFTYNEISS